jgi:hypothetical protein
MIKKEKYFNRAQMEVMAVGAKDTTVIASRGVGKTEGIDAPWFVKMIYAMPRSNGAILSPTYSKLMQNTLPSFCTALGNMGFIRGIHYFVGEKAPARLNFIKPYIEPIDYKYVIHWYNGTIAHLISFDRPMSANSMSLDWFMGMEAKFLDKNKIDNEVTQANRGTKYFSQCPWHHATLYTSDMPTNSSAKWLIERERLADPDLINMIKVVYLQYLETKYKEQTEYYVKKLRQLKKQLDELRSMAYYYVEFDIFENIELIGEKRIAELKRELPPLIFRTSILCEKLRKIPNGFYSALDEKKHYYDRFNNEYIDSLGYDFDKTTVSDCRNDGDITLTLPLRIALDYNAAINSLVVAQVDDTNEMRTLKSFYVKTPRKVRDVVKDFCEYYKHHNTRSVIFYYDHTAVWTNPADNDTMETLVREELTYNGFNVISVYMGQAMRHDQKHHHINESLRGGNPNYVKPTFNRHNNEYLLLAMEHAGIKVGPHGFQKDKSAEKEPDTPDKPDEQKTHITDAWDTLFLGCQFYSDESNSIGSSIYI